MPNLASPVSVRHVLGDPLAGVIELTRRRVSQMRRLPGENPLGSSQLSRSLALQRTDLHPDASTRDLPRCWSK